jgi:hypothetical protein
MLSPFKKSALRVTDQLLNPKFLQKLRAPLLAEFAAEAPNKLRRHFGNVHALGNEKFAAQDWTGLIVVGQLAIHFAILTLLIPAETAIWNGFRADELKCA